jgi:hypothetical protein
LSRPVRDDGSFVLKINAITKVRDTDYFLNASTGHIQLAVALVATNAVTANYRYYTGLVQEAQRIIEGDPNDPENYPGVRQAGSIVQVLPAQVSYQTLDAEIAVSDGFDIASVEQDVRTEIQEYINTLDIGEDVIVAEIIARAMSVTGMQNFTINDLTGSSPAVDQVILENQAARITSAAITLV